MSIEVHSWLNEYFNALNSLGIIHEVQLVQRIV